MISKKNQYFSLNRILLLIIGSWPYEQSNFAKFQHIVICAIMISSIVFQLTTFLASNCTLEVTVTVLADTLFFSRFIIQYIVFHFNIEGVKDLLVQLQHIHNELKNRNEIAIIKKYDSIANRYATVLTAIGICGIFSSIISQFLMNVVNVDSSTNSSRHFFLLSMEYFIDQEKHFYLILLHINIIVTISITAMVANGTMLIAYIQHICGLFRIASYRIKYAININILHNVTPKNKIWMIKHISYAVDIHRQAMKLMKQLMTILNKMIFCLIIVDVASLSLNLYHMVLLKTSFETLLTPSEHTFVSVLYMFLANHMGQIIIDHNNHVFTTAYNVEWYKTPVRVQKMILFVLQRRSKPFTLNVGGLFHASMEGFATLVKSSVSYFTVIHSVQ
ncbi:odorant receptor 49a isoform X2 [Solenopsis invicta]|uniref:odorant receptor 49a isoform X2 n=1 Tax=Solenopsis invicta TaxID=13686 RepID=UPI00193E8F3A|nr:odorant receptor 49a isoform X2 [Solenopsis invicta]